MSSAEIRDNLDYIGMHVTLLATMAGLFFIERYLQLVGRGYGPYITVPSIVGILFVAGLVDLVVLRYALRGSQFDKRLSMLVPAAFDSLALLFLIASNL